MCCEGSVLAQHTHIGMPAIHHPPNPGCRLLFPHLPAATRPPLPPPPSVPNPGAHSWRSSRCSSPAWPLTESHWMYAFRLSGDMRTSCVRGGGRRRRRGVGGEALHRQACASAAAHPSSSSLRASLPFTWRVPIGAQASHQAAQSRLAKKRQHSPAHLHCKSQLPHERVAQAVVVEQRRFQRMMQLGGNCSIRKGDQADGHAEEGWARSKGECREGREGSGAGGCIAAGGAAVKYCASCLASTHSAVGALSLAISPRWATCRPARRRNQG